MHTPAYPFPHPPFPSYYHPPHQSTATDVVATAEREAASSPPREPGFDSRTPMLRTFI